jgi:hypothetical protein
MKPTLLIPGISNSGPEHWQSRWELRHEGVVRVVQRDWDYPMCDEWVEALDAAVGKASEPPILVAHSLGCLAAARWAAQSPRSVHAMLLVAVPDPSGPAFPKQAIGFHLVPHDLGRRHVTVVGSTDDPYSSREYLQRLVRHWNAEYLDLGPKGHINAASGLGEWPEGWALVERLRSDRRAA